MSVDSRTLTERIRAEAIRLGFSSMGVTPAGPLEDGGCFDDWLARGMHGSMEYMKRQAARRKDPSLVLDTVRSILILTCNYHAQKSPAGHPLQGRVSCYAWGSDYHSVMRRRLNMLLAFIRAHDPEAQGICYADTGAVMEKVWGMRTCIGWMGKHSNLITRDQGSWFFLGVILLSRELVYDAPSKDYCGICTNCITACPTGAIVAPYVVDARLCISYLTIELRGIIPRELRHLMGNRIFGCDDCQEVCPWNRFARVTPDHEFFPREGNLMPDLGPLVCMTVEEFDHRFKNSPVRRARRDGFIRNVCVALGNSCRSEALPHLARALGDDSSLVRLHAAWGVGYIGGNEARRILRKARLGENDRDVLEEIDLSLAQI